MSPCDLDLWPSYPKIYTAVLQVIIYPLAKYEKDPMKNDRKIGWRRWWERRKIKSKKEKTLQQQKGLPTLSADLKVGPHSDPSRWRRPFGTLRISTSAKHVNVTQRWIWRPHDCLRHFKRAFDSLVISKYNRRTKESWIFLKTGDNFPEFWNILFFNRIVRKPR